MRWAWRSASEPRQGSCGPGAQQAAVSAEFSVGRNHPAHAILREAGLDGDGEAIVLRRLVGADGRGRAFVNDEPASVGLLRELGDSLVEIQGQFEQRGLLDPANHRMILDAFAEHTVAPAALSQGLAGLARGAAARGGSGAAGLPRAATRKTCCGITSPSSIRWRPKAGKRSSLAARRTLLQSAERLAETLSEAMAELDGKAGAQAALARAARRLERARDRAQGVLDAALAATERAAAETAEALAALEAARRQLELDPRELETVEERLFALRALARKHQVAVADLPQVARADGGSARARSKPGPKASTIWSRATAEARARFTTSAASGLPRAGCRRRPSRRGRSGRTRSRCGSKRRASAPY